MGENLHNMLTELAGMTDEQIREVHPKHDQVCARRRPFGLRCFATDDGAHKPPRPRVYMHKTLVMLH